MEDHILWGTLGIKTAQRVNLKKKNARNNVLKRENEEWCWCVCFHTADETIVGAATGGTYFFFLIIKKNCQKKKKKNLCQSKGKENWSYSCFLL